MSGRIKAIVVSDRCPHCEVLKSELRSRGILDKVKVINVDTPEGFKFAVDNKIMAIPECIVICEDGKCTPCTSKEYRELLEKGT